MIDTKESIASIILLIIEVGICATILIFVSVLSGGVYQSTSSQINSLSTNFVNETINLSFVALPYTYTTSGNIYPGTESLRAWNATADYGALVLNTNYTVLSYPLGQFSIIDLTKRNNTYIYLYISYTTGNPVIEGNITSAIINTFTAINYTGGYLPLIVLALVIILILGMVFAIMPQMGGQMSLPSI
jgi:hypothetical protein